MLEEKYLFRVEMTKSLHQNFTFPHDCEFLNMSTNILPKMELISNEDIYLPKSDNRLHTFDLLQG